MTQTFEVRGTVTSARVPVIAHVPHCGTEMPPGIRADLMLDDKALDRELLRLTDWHTGELFDCVVALGGVMFVNRMSRLVVDPERFRDDSQEEMASRGMGAVYTHTTDGHRLRRQSLGPEVREGLLTEFYDSYHEALEQLTAAMLERFSRCLIIDCHSFPTIPLPYEPDQTPDRPDICIGTDSFHTPERLKQSLANAASALGLSVAENRPFAGTYVPLRFLNCDCRVSSAMIEVKRGLYCDEDTGYKVEAFGRTRAAVKSVVKAAIDAWRESPH